MKDCSLPSAQPPLKRRRLAHSLTSQSTPARVLATTNAKKPTTTDVPIPTCSTCYRALNITHHIQYCARCLSVTCAVCSRTCTASTTSQPPTPTPSSASGLPPLSVLSLNSPNINVILDPSSTPTSNVIAGRRRKLVDRDDLASKRDTGEGREELGPGCGRVLCRDCCFENNQNNSTTCLDCYGSS